MDVWCYIRPPGGYSDLLRCSGCRLGGYTSRSEPGVSWRLKSAIFRIITLRYVLDTVGYGYVSKGSDMDPTCHTFSDTKYEVMDHNSR